MFTLLKSLLSTILLFSVLSGIAQTDCYIPINPSMFFLEDGSSASSGNQAGALADEQASMGDPANGNGAAVNTDWLEPWNPTVVAYIDLGQEYDINAIYLYDGPGSGPFTVAPGLPADNNAPIIDTNLPQYLVWTSYTGLQITTRYLTFTKTGFDGKVREIAICGSPASSDPCDLEVLVGYTSPTCSDNLTPNDPSDDTYSFSFVPSTPDGNIAGQWNAVIEGQTYTGAYNTTAFVNDLPIGSGGTLNFNIIDQDNPNCVSPIVINIPLPCSNENNGDCDVPGTENWANGGGACNDIYRLGKVAIGTSSFGADAENMLLVNGTIRAQRLKVELCAAGGWCDYVFAPNYQLPPLAEVEQFIQLNKHLPNIPSEEELLQKGTIDVGRITVKQQEKIEEVFLYLIDMEKKIQGLTARVNQLELENEKLRQQDTRN